MMAVGARRSSAVKGNVQISTSNGDVATGGTRIEWSGELVDSRIVYGERLPRLRTVRERMEINNVAIH
jgi:hypothetical protein